MTDDADSDPADASHFEQTSRRDFLRTTAVAGIAAAGLGAGAIGSSTAAGIPTPRLHVDGNVLKDPDGNTVKLRGINMADPKRLNVTAPARGKNAEQVADLLTDGDRGWYPRVVRVPAQPSDIGEHEPGHSGGPPTPVAFTQAELEAYLEEHYDPIVEQLRRRGVYMIVDFHRHWTDGPSEWDGYWDEMQDELDEEVTMFWDTVAERYADQDHVLFELYNEPTEPGMWGDPTENDGVAETWLEWKDLAQPWVDTIREHADNVVIVGSPSWTQSPEGYYVEPFEGENLAYAFHIYSGHQSSSGENWDDASENGEGVNEVYEDVPLIVTEFGWETNNSSASVLQGTTSEFGEPFFEWLEQSESISYTAWCADPVWRPVMFTRPWTEDDPSQPVDIDSIGHPYEDGVREDCPNPPCEWELLGGESYAGEYVKAQLAEYREDDLPGAAYDDVAPPAPDGLTVTESSFTEIDVEWDAVSDPGEAGMSHYVVTVDGEAHARVYEGTSTTIEGLTAETDYEIGVAAQDRAGNRSEETTVAASTDSFEDDSPPTPPSNLEAVEVGQNDVDLAWEPGEPGGDAWITGYQLYVDGVPEDEVGADRTTASVAGLQFETTYELGVATMDAAGNVSDAVTVTATPTSHEEQEPYEGPHTIPGEVPAIHHDTGGQGVGFETERGGGGGPRDDGASMEQSGSDYEYHLAHIAAGDWWEYTVDAEGPGVYDLEVGAAQAVGEHFGRIGISVSVNGEQVASISSEGTGGWQEFEGLDGGEVELPAGPNIVRLTATDGEFNIAWWAMEGEPGTVPTPEAPESLTATVTGDGVELSWGPVSDADLYTVYVDGEQDAVVSGTAHTIEGLETGETYDVGLTASNDGGESSLVETTVTVDDDPCEAVGAEDGETLSNGNTVCDLDGDGNYRDLTASGDTTTQDLQYFFEHQHREPYDRRPDLFDFTGNGEVGQPDVVDLFHEI